MSFLDVDALREGSEMPLSEEYGENLSLSLVCGQDDGSHVLDFTYDSMER
jgi:hypothetical protein